MNVSALLGVITAFPILAFIRHIVYHNGFNGAKTMSKELVVNSESARVYIERMVQNAEKHGIRINVVGMYLPMAEQTAIFLNGKGKDDYKRTIEELEGAIDTIYEYMEKLEKSE